jgi:hypothetical protein
MFRFTIRELVLLTLVVAMGTALVLSQQRQAAQLRDLVSVRGELESVVANYTRAKRSSRNAIGALIGELEKDRGLIGHYSFHPDRQNPDQWNVKLELLERPSP